VYALVPVLFVVMKILLSLSFGLAAADGKHCVHFLYHHSLSSLKVFVYRKGSCIHVLLLGRLVTLLGTLC